MGKTRPKDIGTAAETAVLKVVQPFWPKTDNGGGARREILHGHRDIGDIVGCGATMFEVKGGNAARTASSFQVEQWIEETRRERIEGGHKYGILVTQRAGVGPANAHLWWAHITVTELADILGACGHANPAVVRLTLKDLLGILADQGFTSDAAA